MAPQSDPRRFPGAIVHALAMHVTSEAECTRRFGSQKKTKLVVGRVVEVEVDRSIGRANTFIVVDFEMGGGKTKRKRLNIRSIKAGYPPQQPDVEPLLPAETAQSQEMANGPQLPHPRQKGSVAYSTNAGQRQSPAPEMHLPVLVNDTLWEHPKDSEDQQTVGGPVHGRCFGIKTITGEVLSANCDFSTRSAIDYFLMIFPNTQLRAMVSLTNRELGKLNLRVTSSGEILKFIGVPMLCTRYEFGERRSLWCKEPQSKYLPAPNFGKTGISRSRFDSLFRCIRFSEQPEQRGCMSSEQHRWSLVDDFVTRFCEHRARHVIPAERLCVDESISRWYGQGGDWINHGLPMYVAIDRKPENGCEIQNSACGLSGIMLRLRLVKTAEEDDSHLMEKENGLLHVTVVLKELVAPGAKTGRIVCADSYFASVMAALELKKMGLRFIGVVKTATRNFPIQELSRFETTERGDSHCLVSKVDGRVNLMARLWVDRDRRYFILSASSRAPGTPYRRKRWRQIDDAPNAEPQHVELTVPQPEAAEIYYSACAQINRHNRCRQKDLPLEKKIGTLDSSMRVNLSLLGMCIVDAWLAFKICKGERCFITQRDFYTLLTMELIDNSFASVGHRERQSIVN